MPLRIAHDDYFLSSETEVVLIFFNLTGILLLIQVVSLFILLA